MDEVEVDMSGDTGSRPSAVASIFHLCKSC